MAVDVNKFDFNEIQGKVIEVVWNVIQIPFEIWDGFSPTTRTLIKVGFGLMALALVYWAWKNREEWRHYHYS